MRKTVIILLVAIVAISSCTEAQLASASKQLGNVLGEELTTENVVAGLKEALVNGTSKGSTDASKMDGFYKNSLIKIPFPPKVQKVENRLRYPWYE